MTNEVFDAQRVLGGGNTPLPFPESPLSPAGVSDGPRDYGLDTPCGNREKACGGGHVPDAVGSRFSGSGAQQ